MAERGSKVKLVHHSHLTQAERQQAYPVDQALERVCKALLDRRPLEGLDQLRASLLKDLGSVVLEQVEQGEWLLLKVEDDGGDGLAVAQAFDPAVLDLMSNPPPQPTRTPRIFRLVDSVTGEPLAQQPYIATVDGVPTQRRTDASGIAHLFTADDVRQISMRIFNI